MNTSLSFVHFSFGADLATRILDRAVQYLEDAQNHKADLVDSNADVLSIWGSCLHAKARIVDNQSQGDRNPATSLVEKAIEILVKAESMQGEQGDAKTLEVVCVGKKKKSKMQLCLLSLEP